MSQDGSSATPAPRERAHGPGTPDAPPPRETWPEPAAQTEAGAALTDLILLTFRLHGRLQEAAQVLAAEGQISAAWWQVIGGVLDQPRPVAEIARRMGMTRQGVQRIADLLVERGLAVYETNPAHRRAKLLAPTQAGYWAVRRISLAQHPWAEWIGEAVGADDLRTAAGTLQRLVEILERSDGGVPEPRRNAAGVPEPRRNAAGVPEPRRNAAGVRERRRNARDDPRA